MGLIHGLGGTIFVHNAVRFDYCVSEAIASLCDVCEDVVVLDAQSDDGTAEVLAAAVKRHPNLMVYYDGVWDCKPDYRRLAELTDHAQSYLKTKWHFALQADEVLHERSHRGLAECCANRAASGFTVRRCNLYGDFDHMIGYDVPASRKPCGDAVMRLALTGIPSYGDGESLAVPGHLVDGGFVDKITIYHYGYVREDASNIRRILDMQSWYHGTGSIPDGRVLIMDPSHFDWQKMTNLEDLRRVPLPHPKYAAEWVEFRKQLKRPVEEK